MIKEVYKDALAVLAKKPVRLWGISLLGGLLGGVASLLCGAVPIVGLAVTLLLEVGLMMVFLHGLHGEQVYAVQLFDCFQDWATIKRVLCGMGWMILWVFLWGLIPIVGCVFALIKAYTWRLVPYIMALEPDVKPAEALKISAERTMGYKSKMFWADVLPAVGIAVVSLVLGLLSRIPVVGVLFTLILAIVIIVFCLFISLFQGLVQADFYEKIMADAQAKAEQAAALEASRRICPNCGAEVFGGAFCPSCGTKLEE